MEYSKKVSLEDLISDTQDKYEMAGHMLDVPYEYRKVMWNIAMDAIGYAIRETVEYYDEFNPVYPPDCEHGTNDDDNDDDIVTRKVVPIPGTSSSVVSYESIKA